jgi:uncharacterized phage protein gp47/JayE
MPNGPAPIAGIPNPQSYDQLNSDMLSTYAAKVGITDFNVGSAVTGFFETVALTTARASGDIFQILRDFSIDRATGDALKNLALENNVTPIVSAPASGPVNVVDTSFNKIATKIYAGANPPNVGSVTINVSDASLFTPTGSVYLGRGTPNVEGPLPYTLIVPVGGYFAITLSSPTTKFHNTGESVILAQGGNRAIPVNSIVVAPALGSNAAIQYSVIAPAVILDGETTVTGVQVTALTPGSAGNVPAGAIQSFASPPFTGATVANALPFVTGKDSETDDALRIRIKNALASTGLGTATAVESAVIGASPSDEQATVVSDNLILNASGAILYIDSGTGYEAKSTGVGLESIVDSALGGEQFFQLATGGRQAPVAKAFLQSTLSAPFDLIGGDTLAVTVGEVTYQHIFANSDFISPGGATAFEVTASINADTLLGFEATTAGNGEFVVIRANYEGNDSIQVVKPTTSGRDAAIQIGFSSNKVQTLRLYKNQIPLSKDGAEATVFTQSQALWSPAIANGDTLILAVDGTAPITYTVNDADFVATGLYSTVNATNSLASWVQVFLKKLTGVTTAIIGQQLTITSNLGANNRASIVIDPTSTLVTKGMFSTIIGLTSQGAASDFILSRNTAQFELIVPLVAGDKLSAGSNQTEARIQSASISGSSILFTTDAHVWLLIDNPGTIIPNGVAGNTVLVVSTPATNTIRYTSSNANAFVNVLPGDYVVIWSNELNVANRTEARVHANTANSLDIVVTAAEYAAAVPQSVVFVDGFVTLRSTLAPQRFRVSAGTLSLDQIVLELQSQTNEVTFSVQQEEFIVVRTNTKDTNGSLLVVTADTQGKLLLLPLYKFSTSQESLIAYLDSQTKDAQLPLFIHSTFAAGSFANPPDTFINSVTTTISFAGRDPNELLSMLHPYGAIKDEQPYGEYDQVTSIAGSVVGLQSEYLMHRVRIADRFYIANPLDFGSADTIVVILDNNPETESFTIPIYRRAIANNTQANNPSNFNAYDVDSGATALFDVAFLDFDFSNFKVLMQAKKVLKQTAAQTGILYRATRWGRSGEKIQIRYSYPSAPNSAIGSNITVGRFVDINLNLQSGAVAPTSIDPTTEWNVTITPNTPVAGVDQVTYTWSGVGTAPALTLLGGEYVNITNQTEFVTANTGIYRVSTQAGFTPTATSFSIQQLTGTAVVQSNVATNVIGAITFYQASPTTAAQMVAYVNANLLDITATLVNDGGVTGAGVLTFSTYEDSNFTAPYIQLADGINWIQSSDLIGSPEFTFKVPLAYSFDGPSSAWYTFNAMAYGPSSTGEELRIIPTTQDQVRRLISVLAVTGFTTEGDVLVVERGSRLELTTMVLGSLGAIQIIGGYGNGYQVPVLDSAIRLDNTYMIVSANRIASAGMHSDQWFRLQASIAQAKDDGFSSNTGVTIQSNNPVTGRSLITLSGRTLTQRYFGKPRNFIRTVGDTFRIEKQGALVCLSWTGVGPNPLFSTSLNFNDAGGGNINVYALPNSNDSQYIIEGGSANFTALSIGDLFTVSGLPQAGNNGTFLVTGVSADGTVVEVLNPLAENEFSNGTFTFTGNSTAGDAFTVGATILVAGTDFPIGGTQQITAANLATVIGALAGVTATAVGSVVTVTATTVSADIALSYTGSPVVTVSGGTPVPGVGAVTAQADALSAYTSLAALTYTPIASDLDGQVLTAGNYSESSGTFNLATSGPATLTLSGSATDVFVFKAASTLVTGAGGIPTITLTGGALAKNVYWIVGSSATLNSGNAGTFQGNVIAQASITDSLGGTVNGSLIALVGAVTLSAATNVIAQNSPLLLSAGSFAILGASAVTSTGFTVLTGNLGISPGTSITGFPPGTFSGSEHINDTNTVITSALAGDAFVAGDFTSLVGVQEGDTMIVGAPFNILNQGSYRVIREYNNSVWFENPDVIEEEVSLSAVPISITFDNTTSFSVTSVNGIEHLSWNGIGTEPSFTNVQVGDLLNFGLDFAVANQGTFAISSFGGKLPELTQILVPPGSAFSLVGAGTYFNLYSAGSVHKDYVWFNTGANTDPAPVGYTSGIMVPIVIGNNSTQVAMALAAAVNGFAGDFTATSTGNLVNISTTDSIETTHATNFNVPSPFAIVITQAGRRAFIEVINPSMVVQSAVLVTTSFLTVNRPQLQFFEYEATVPNDLFTITSGVLGATNQGSWPIDQVIDQNTIIVNAILAPATNVSLNGNESAVFVTEGVPYTGYKHVFLVASQPGAPTRNDIVFDTNAQYEKIDEAAGVQMVSLGKEEFSTSIRLGLDSYRYNTGLIAEANRIIYGDPRDPITYPGVGAAGAEIFVQESLTLRVQISLVVRLNTGVAFSQIITQVRSSVSSLINSNPVGQPIAISSIISAVNAIPGVRAMAISSPQYDSTHDLIFVAPSEKARILDPTTDISVSQIGS